MTGILLVDKPAGWTSMDVCAKLRGVFHEKRVGHSGTLDPMATGLLVVFLGRATRAIEFAESHDKCYEATLRLGLVTDTQDTSGNLLERHPVELAPGALERVLPKFRGAIQQTPPMYSAIKIDGQKLYQVARRGGQVDRVPRPITIHALEYVGQTPEGDYMLSIRCSKGTYIRTLCHDIGQALGCGGAMSSLRRTSVGFYQLRDAYTMEEILNAAEAGRVEELSLPLDSLFSEARPLRLCSFQEGIVRNGGDYTSRLAEGDYRLYGQSGEFLAIARAFRGKMHLLKSFFAV